MILSSGLIPSQALAHHLRCSQLEAVEVGHVLAEVVAERAFVLRPQWPLASPITFGACGNYWRLREVAYPRPTATNVRPEAIRAFLR